MQTLEIVLLFGLCAVALLLIAAMPPSQPRQVPVDNDRRRQRFDGAVELLRQQGFVTDRMLISFDGSMALFVGEKCGRACILRVSPEGKLLAEMRDLRTMTTADAAEVVAIAPNTGFFGRLRGDPEPGTRQIVDSELKVAFDAKDNLPPVQVVIKFRPSDAVQARFAASALRGEQQQLLIADAKAEARSKAAAEAAEPEKALEMLRSQKDREAQAAAQQAQRWSLPPTRKRSAS